MPRLRARVLFLALFLSAIAAAPFFIRASQQKDDYFLELSLVNRFPGTLQVFYNVGRAIGTGSVTGRAVASVRRCLS